MAGAEEQDGAVREEEYRAALNQAGLSDGPVREASAALNGTFAGEASPGKLESGEAGGMVGSGSAMGSAGVDPLPTANPFHSERVRTEVELIRSRPATLDQDARRLRVDPDSPNLGEAGGAQDKEPNYASALSGRSDDPREAPRVARVELAAEEGKAALASEAGGVRTENIEVEHLMSSRDPKEESPGLDQNVLGPDPFGPEDARELIPAAEQDRLGKLESLLVQVMAENKSLKRRLEQNESRSHSSWHSGIAVTEQGMLVPPEPFSPATFGPKIGRDVQAFVSSDFSGQPGLDGNGSNFRGVGSGWDGVFPGNSQPWTGPRQEVVSSSLEAHRLELYPLGTPPRAGETCFNSPSPPVPLPLPPAPATLADNLAARSAGPQNLPQTMRQFAEHAIAEITGTSGNSGFQTPRGLQEGISGFDAEGYPLSPGGTVIRPPPLPPAVTSAGAWTLLSGAPIRPQGLGGSVASPLGTLGGVLGSSGLLVPDVGQVRDTAGSLGYGEVPGLGSALDLGGIPGNRDDSRLGGTQGLGGAPLNLGGTRSGVEVVRPEEPARYISESRNLLNQIWLIRRLCVGIGWRRLGKLW